MSLFWIFFVLIFFGADRHADGDLWSSPLRGGEYFLEIPRDSEEEDLFLSEEDDFLLAPWSTEDFSNKNFSLYLENNGEQEEFDEAFFYELPIDRKGKVHYKPTYETFP